ncbi:hypothetical protein [Leptolyngbya sp. NIES-2104]|nr:hypothetical protein [Leptolyngbya sp. NIES-2104]GAP96915.1 hypothetical protein NIES2104_34620 [Leptolyngbya sp. NIES-2104]
MSPVPDSPQSITASPEPSPIAFPSTSMIIKKFEPLEESENPVKIKLEW